MTEQKIIIDINNMPEDHAPAEYLISELIKMVDTTVFNRSIEYTIDIYGYMTCNDLLARTIMIKLMQDNELPFCYGIKSTARKGPSMNSLPANIKTITSIL